MLLVPAKERRRIQILAAALDVFGDKGYHSTGVADILDHAGISRGTFYQYFESKRQVFEELLDETLEQIRAVLKPVDLADPHRTVYQQLRDNGMGLLMHLFKRPALARLILAEAPGVDAEIDKRLESFYDQVISLLEETLRFGQTVGLVRDLDPHTVSICIVGSVKELIYQHMLRGVPIADPGRLVESLLDYNLQGVFRSRS